MWALLSTHLVTVAGNLLIILAILSDSQFHMPNPSLVDVCFTSTTVPKMLVNIQMQSKAIIHAGCITQMFFLVLFAGFGEFLLTVMAYDSFVAICPPLHTITMNPWLCGLLALVSSVTDVPSSLVQTPMMLQLSFCTNLEIPTFLCEPNELVHLACDDTFPNHMVVYFLALLLGGGPLAGICYSYFKIVSSICAVSSAQGKYKAFSTCASHLTVFSLFYCSCLGVYLSSAAAHNSHSGATASVMYTMVTPMLNPFIYSLRNTDMKRALKRLLGWTLRQPLFFRKGLLSPRIRERMRL